MSSAERGSLDWLAWSVSILLIAFKTVFAGAFVWYAIVTSERSLSWFLQAEGPSKAYPLVGAAVAGYMLTYLRPLTVQWVKRRVLVYPDQASRWFQIVDHVPLVAWGAAVVVPLSVWFWPLSLLSIHRHRRRARREARRLDESAEQELEKRIAEDRGHSDR